MMNLQEWKINNLIIELTYAPSPHFFKKRTELIENLYMTFPNFNSQNMDSITMHTTNNPGINLNILPNRLVLIFEQLENIDILGNNKKLCVDILNALEISIIQRFGMRVNMVKKTDTKAADEILNKFFDNRFKDLSLVDSGYNLNFKSDSNLNIRIALNKGISQNLQINFNQVSLNQVNQQSNMGIITDIVVSKENVNTEEIIGLIDIALKEYEKCQLVIE